MRSACLVLLALLGSACSSSPDSGPHGSPSGDSGIPDSRGSFFIDSGIQCVDAGRDAAEAGSCTPSRGTVSFSKDIAPILSSGCSGEACHGSAGWGVYSAVVSAHSHECCDGRPLVVPGAPDRSYLVHKLSGHGMCMGVPMPKNAAALAPAEMQSIRDWICLGAKKN